MQLGQRKREGDIQTSACLSEFNWFLWRVWNSRVFLVIPIHNSAITPDSLLDFKAPEKKEICEIICILLLCLELTSNPIVKFAKPTQILKIEIVSSCRMCEIYTKYEGKSFSYSGTMRCYLIDDSEKIDESLKYNILSGSLSTQNKTQFVEQLKIKCVSMKNPQLFQFHHLSLQTGSQNSVFLRFTYGSHRIESVCIHRGFSLILCRNEFDDDKYDDRFHSWWDEWIQPSDVLSPNADEDADGICSKSSEFV